MEVFCKHLEYCTYAHVKCEDCRHNKIGDYYEKPYSKKKLKIPLRKV